jgi:hypothetical protein
MGEGGSHGKVRRKNVPPRSDEISFLTFEFNREGGSIEHISFLAPLPFRDIIMKGMFTWNM